MELDHEKFQGARELAEISTKIAAGTAALAQLKEDESAYLDEREGKLVARLKQALVDSQELIKDIGANHDALIGYRNELGSFYESVLSLIQGVDACKELVLTAADDLDVRITNHEEEVKAFKTSTRNVSIQIESERAELAAWRDKLGEQQRKFDDRYAMLERNLARVKPK